MNAVTTRILLARKIDLDFQRREIRAESTLRLIRHRAAWEATDRILKLESAPAPALCAYCLEVAHKGRRL